MTGLEVEFLPVGEKSRAGDAIAIRYGEPHSFQLIVVDGGTAASGETLMEHLTSICGGAVPIVRDLVITHRISIIPPAPASYSRRPMCAAFGPMSHGGMPRRSCRTFRIHGGPSMA
jgi:hypothetical protein